MYDTDTAELRDIEERLYQMAERWLKHDPDNHATIFDCGMLASARQLLDVFLCDSTGGRKWIHERDNRRAEARIYLAMDLARHQRESAS